jgi:hypothetical protein
VAYFGETPKLNFTYRIEKDAWLARRARIPGIIQ